MRICQREKRSGVLRLLRRKSLSVAAESLPPYYWVMLIALFFRQQHLRIAAAQRRSYPQKGDSAINRKAWRESVASS